MDKRSTVLAAVLEAQGLQRYGSFCAAYDKAAQKVDRKLVGTAPSRAQFHRWLTGGTRNLPHTDHCRVIEQMVEGYLARELFSPCPDDGAPPPAQRSTGMAATTTGQQGFAASQQADVIGAFATRSDFMTRIQPQALFTDAHRIRAAGLSLNLICQQLPDQHLTRLISGGAQLTCLFLDPSGEAIKARNGRKATSQRPCLHLPT